MLQHQHLMQCGVQVDLLLVPTALQNYLVVEIEAEEKCRQPPTWDKNTLLGRFTNFVNLLDMAAVSVPSTLIHCMERTAELRAAGATPSMNRMQHIAGGGCSGV